jgi:hypothetical protein
MRRSDRRSVARRSFRAKLLARRGLEDVLSQPPAQDAETEIPIRDIAYVEFTPDGALGTSAGSDDPRDARTRLHLPLPARAAEGGQRFLLRQRPELADQLTNAARLMLRKC